MGRHRTPQEKHVLGEQARAMRAEGRSRREIQQVLGIGDDLAKAFLRGVPLPDRLQRPRAKDEARLAAIELRRAGRTYDEIALELGVSKSSCSLWLRDVVPTPAAGATDGEDHGPGVAAAADGDACSPRDRARDLRRDGLVLREIADLLGTSVKTVYYWTWDLPVPPAGRRKGGDKANTDMMRRRYWDRFQAEREHERVAVRALHAARVGRLTGRELELAAVVAYWCEGTKSKAWQRREQVTFINSDLGLVLLFLAWLDDVGFPVEHRKYALSIHESADVSAAEAWWSQALGVPLSKFGPATLKRHNPVTVRKNVGSAYVGCVIVRLVQCRTLYQRIEGVWQGIMDRPSDGGEDDHSRVV